ncbi:hypothetical protein GCM10009775_04830 [Microbacterium aoyamense]|uniref:Concanavalin A-like lectin/glucanases superfamily protein n=1 Tax=Microbacterium aoyamense TaxID=344166 RepID=A0ABN2P8R8_9MICO|nr:LamG domain-containing protein [Microbacterium aoyamense]
MSLLLARRGAIAVRSSLGSPPLAEYPFNEQTGVVSADMSGNAAPNADVFGWSASGGDGGSGGVVTSIADGIAAGVWGLGLPASTSTWTVRCWARAANLTAPTTRFLFAVADDAYADIWCDLRVDTAGVLRGVVQNPTGWSTLYNGNFGTADTNGHKFAIVRNGTSVLFYRDGTLLGTATGLSRPPQSTLAIEMGGNDGGSTLVYADSLRIFDRAQSAAEGAAWDSITP